MPNKIKQLLTISLLILCVPSIGWSLATTDTQFWLNLTVLGPLSKRSEKLRYWFENQARFGEEISQLSQYIFRPGIGYMITPQLSIWLGYASIYTTLPFTTNAFTENRVWQQLLWISSYKPVQLQSRTRLEERMFPDQVTTMRFRQLFKVQIPFHEDSKFSLIGSDEMFIHMLNPNQQGFDQNRAFIGLCFRTTDNLVTEIGYLNQHIRRVQAGDYTGHNIALNLFFTY